MAAAFAAFAPPFAFKIQCKVIGCKLNCIQHICRNCQAIDSHRTANCPKLIPVCKVAGCKLGCKAHTCKVCRAVDAHRAKDCPQLKIQLVQKSQVQVQQHQHQHLKCKVAGCMLGCKIHTCKVCHAVDAHRAKNCPKIQAQMQPTVQGLVMAVHNGTAWKLIQQMASVDPTRRGDNSSTSCSVVFFNRTNGVLNLYIHRRSANIKHGLTLSSAGGVASFNRTWSDSLAREAYEESGVDISSILQNSILLTNYKGTHHQHVAVALELPANIKIQRPSHVHELDPSFGNSTNHHEWVDAKSLLAGKYGKVHIQYSMSVQKLKTLLGI
jgi:hypothetical protein